MTGGSWRVAGRLARREVRRHPWRHALVVALIAVPVLAVFATFSLLETSQRAAERQREFQLAGRDGAFGDRVNTGEGISLRGGDAVDLGGDPSALPPGTTIEPMHRSADWFVTDRERADGAGPQLAGAEVIDAPDGSRRAAKVVVDEGRLPRDAAEIVLTPSLAAAGGWAIGDEVESARTAQRFEVVGIGRLGASVDDAAAIVGDVAPSYWTEHLGAASDIETASGKRMSVSAWREDGIWLPDGPDDQALWRAGAEPMAPVQQLDERVRPGIILGATAVCALAATVASAAFALASRRQLRSIGLLSSIGTDPGTIRRLLVLQGALPGLVGGLVAVALGVAAAAIASSVDATERVTQVAGAELVLSFGGAVLAVVLAVASGVAAAWFPARAASRVPVLIALSGRRPAGPLPSRVPLGGLVLWAAGLLLLVWGVRAGRQADAGWAPFALIIGTLALALGAIAVAPLLVVGLDRLARRARGIARLAVRGLVRQRGQSAATIAAVAVALALPVGFLTARNAAEEPETEVVDIEAVGPSSTGPMRSLALDDATIVQVEGDLRSAAAADLTDAVVDVLSPEATVVETLALADDDGAYWMVTALPPAVAAGVLEPEAAAAIAAGQLVRTNAAAPGARPVALRSGDDRLPLEVAPLELGDVAGLPGGYLVSSDVLGDFGQGRPISGRSVLRAGAPTDAEATALARLSPSSFGSGMTPTPPLDAIRSAPDEAVGFEDPTAWAWLASPADEGPWASSPSSGPSGEDRLLLALAAASALIACTILAITLSLRGYDGRDDARAALAAGASPARLRSLRAVEGTVLALTGAALALPLGWSAVAAARLGRLTRTPHDPTLLEAAGRQLAGPGWIVVPILLIPAVVAGVLWLVVPAIRGWAAERRGPRDLLAPRW